MLLSGTVAFVVTLTLLARIVDRLIDLAVALGRRSLPNRGPARSRRRTSTGLPRMVVVGMLAGLLLFALAWSTFVLGRARDLG